MARRLAINQAIWAMGVEPQHPVADNLETDTADLGGFTSRAAIINRSQSQKPPCLRTIFRALRDCPKANRIKVFPKLDCCRHDEHPMFVKSNQTFADSGIPPA